MCEAGDSLPRPGGVTGSDRAGGSTDPNSDAGKRDARAAELEQRDQTLRAELAAIRADPASVDQKNPHIVMALVKYFASATEPLEAEAVMMLDLLSPTARKYYVYAVRVIVATAVAMLRAARMDNPEIKSWLGREIGADGPPGLTAENAIRWFYDCTEGGSKTPPVMVEEFKRGWSPSVQLTKAEAQINAAQILNRVRLLAAGSLTLQEPRRPR